MHDIEPYYKWREYYVASDDKMSPFYGRQYDEFKYSQKIYNYFIHPQWDDFGSKTLYMKILYVDYDKEIACIELIGEWNDCLHNDVMFLKRDVVDFMVRSGIKKYIVFCDNVLVFHSGEDDYYEEWYQDVCEDGGWITFVNLQDQVMYDMQSNGLQYYVNFGLQYNNMNWRRENPKPTIAMVESLMQNSIKQLRY